MLVTYCMWLKAFAGGRLDGWTDGRTNGGAGQVQPSAKKVSWFWKSTCTKYCQNVPTIIKQISQNVKL